MSEQKSRIYKPLNANGYELCHPVNRDFGTIVAQINGHPRQATWQPLEMRLIQEYKGKKWSRSDSPWLGSDSLIFRPAAVLALGQLLRAHGELLPLRCEDAELWIFNPRLLDALDEAASTIERVSTGSIMRITQHVFRPDVVHGVHAFKVPNLRVSPTFVSQHFADLWKKAQLKGLKFNKVW